MNTSARNTQEDFTNQGAVVDDGASPSTSSSLEAPEPHYVVPKVTPLIIPQQRHHYLNSRLRHHRYAQYLAG